jgi:YggT family protein
MEGTMQIIFRFLAMLLNVYSFLIIIRIILTWFSHAHHGKPVQLLARVTDPYLNWWRQTFNLRVGVLDISPIVAMAALSVLRTICSSIASYGSITPGVILAVCLTAVWSAASFILGFCFFVLVLRFIAYISNSNMYSMFWRVIDTISRPLLYRINRIIFGNRLVKFSSGILVSIAILAAIWIGGRFVVQLLTGLLLRMGVN